MERPPRFTLAQIFFVGLAVLTVLVGGLFYLFVEGSRGTVLEGADRLRDAAAGHVERVVHEQLGEADDAVTDIERRIGLGVVAIDDPAALVQLLTGQVIDRPDLAEITFTRATRVGFAPDGKAKLAPERWQASVFRPLGGGDRPSLRVTRRQGSGFEAELVERADTLKRSPAPDPTAHSTFETLARRELRGRAVWSDLHYSALDEAMPVAERRIVVTLQKAIEDPHGGLVGVIRVGLLPRQLDAVAKLGLGSKPVADPHQVFLCDDRGRLLTRLAPGDAFVEDGEDLRVSPSALPEPVSAALASPILASLGASGGDGTGAVLASGKRHLVTFRALSGTQGWNVGIVVPEEHYTRTLERVRQRTLGLFVGVAVLALVAGAAGLRVLQRGLGRLSDATARMRRFDFSAQGGGSAFRDLSEVVDGLERAKTVVRAMGKYLPMDLVRRLYDENKDPVLGGELHVVTLMFTDIEGFATLSEKLPPTELAQKLGLYLETMTTAVQATEGTIDKYIGDAIMAFWNAPGEVEGHPSAACKAALACVAATRELYASEAWAGLPPLVTRYGIHSDCVMVGHFGAPARLSYTALGDGVNLAARLEPLCKQYGVFLAVSEAVEAEARGAFEFRRLDRVAVKGKTKGVVVFELLGAKGDAGLPLEAARTYEAALEAYFDRRFAEARATLAPQLDDPPSKVLFERCARLEVAPPPEGWDGVHIASAK